MKNKRIVLIGIIVSFLGFLIIAGGIVTDVDWTQQLDAFGNQVFRLDISHYATDLILRTTHIGGIPMLTITALIVGAILLFKKKFLGFLWFGISMVTIGGLTPGVLKVIFARPRPIDGLMTRGGYSFPSGHTMGTLALYGLLIILVVVYIRQSWQKYLIVVTSLAIILLVSWSRIHLGVHFLTDIIGSSFLGVSLLLVVWQLFLVLREKFGED